ncbi:MAG: hypothetical protein AAF518_28250 [Spirochaetota bacterium]
MTQVAVHPITFLVYVGSTFLVPLIALGTYLSSGASLRKSLAISLCTSVWGLIMFLFARYWQFEIGNPVIVWLLVFINLLWPSLLVIVYRDFFIGDGLSMAWLTFVQATRYMGGLFILENLRGLTGIEFAYTSGFGDVIAAVIATTLLLQLLTGGSPNKFVYLFLICFGTLDFVIAYSLSFLSSQGIPFQTFALGEGHYMSLFPLAQIPFFLVPFAMANHIMMYLTIRKTNLA